MLIAIVVVCAVVVTGVLPQLPDPPWLVLLALLWLLLGVCFKLKACPQRSFTVRVWVVLGVFLVSLSWSVKWGQARLNERLQGDLEQQWLLIKGQVEGLPEPFKFDAVRHGVRLLLNVDEACIAPDKDCWDHRVQAPDRIRLNWYGGNAPASGEQWQLLVKLKRPHGYQNPGGFDYERWLLSRSIGATGYVRQSPHNRRLNVAPWWSIDGWRHTLRRQISAVATQSGSGDSLGLVLALLLGDKSYLKQPQRQELQALGLAHLLAISGLHIGLAASLGALLGALVGRCLNCCFPTRIYTPSVVVMAAWVMALIYAALAGFSVPTQRALIMLSVWVWFGLSGASASPWFGWWFAMAVVLLLQPLGFYEIGFWLSFGAVAVLIACFRADMAVSRPLWLVFLRAQGVLLLGVGLIQWFSGLPVSLLAPLANAMAIPFVGFVVTPLLFLVALASLTADSVFTNLVLSALWLLDLFQEIVHVCIDSIKNYQSYWLWQPGARVTVFAMLPALLGLGLWMLPMPLSFKGLSFLTMVVGFYGNAGKSTDMMVIRVLDVGQGLAVSLHRKGRHWLIDSGRDYHFDFVLQPYFRSMAVRRLDGLLLSHGDSDHAGAVSQVLSGFDVGTLYVGNAELLSEEKSRQQNWTQTRWRDCDIDQSWQVANLRFETIGWQNSVTREPRIDSNNNSCVLLLEYAGVRILLPGDIEKEREVDLLTHSSLQSGIDVVLVPHHGSRTSSSADFVHQLAPDWALVSAGYQNQYGHPAKDVVDRYRRVGATVVNTADAGAISVLIGTDGGYRVVGYRDQNRRYWR